MLRPASLALNDEIRILTTARKINREEISAAKTWLESYGMKVSLGKTIELTDHQYGGTDSDRANDFQEALDDTTVKAIWFARGGYGSIRISDTIQWDNFIENPKWLIGFSDITIWHNLINQFYGIQSIHGLMPITFSTNTEIAKNLLIENITGNFPTIEFDQHEKNYQLQEIEGEIIGGNLSILYSLLGTKSGFNTNGKILFIEEIDEYLYHIDRMIISLKHSGKLEGLKALVVGGFTDIKDNEIPFGKTYEEIILEHTKAYGYPVVFGFPSGHIEDNRPICLGAKVKISISDSIQLKYL